jgi:hypothetical protein
LDEFTDGLEDIRDDFFVSRDAESNGIFEHDGKELSGGWSAIDRLVETGFEQVGDTSYVIDVYVGQQESVDAIEGEIDFGGFASFFSIASLEGSAVDED